MKALIIKVISAGFFDDPRISRSQDKVYCYGTRNNKNGYISRYDKRRKSSTSYLQVPRGYLSYKHVANLLRVFFGQRPVPTLRKVHESFSKLAVDRFEELAKKVRVSIDTPISDYFSKYKKSLSYPSETVTIRKSIKDSWQTSTIPFFLDGKYVPIRGGLLYKDRLRRILGEYMYSKFKDLMGNFGPYSSIQEAVEILNRNKADKRVEDFCALCCKEGCTSFSNIILNKNKDGKTVSGSITFHSSKVLNQLMVLGSVQEIEKFDATLYVPVTEEDLDMVDNGTGVASFLEGGFAKIIEVQDWSEQINLMTRETVEGTYVCDKNS